MGCSHLDYPSIAMFDLVDCNNFYALYSDLSAQVMKTFSQFSANMKVYSIDEAFLDMTGFSQIGYQQHAEKIKRLQLSGREFPSLLVLLQQKH